jgi:cobalt/nickel transport system ATP-binding protein
MAALFELESVTFSYDGVVALDGLTMTVQSGQRLALLGANGSGKSTLLKLLDALQFAGAGKLSFCGEALTEDRFAHDAFQYSFRKRVGFVFQNPDVQLFSPSVRDELEFGPAQLRLPPGEMNRRVTDAMDLFEISHLADRAPYHLSGGEKKKVALASVLVMQPEVVLLDEPTSGLDPRSQTNLINLLDKWDDGSKTIITATHDLHMLEDLAGQCVILERGRLIAEGNTADILGDRDLLQRANLIHAHRSLRHSGMHAHHHLHDEQRHSSS